MDTGTGCSQLTDPVGTGTSLHNFVIYRVLSACESSEVKNGSIMYYTRATAVTLWWDQRADSTRRPYNNIPTQHDQHRQRILVQTNHQIIEEFISGRRSYVSSSNRSA